MEVICVLKILIWPVIVALGLFMFRKSIIKKIEGLSSFEGPGNTKATFNKDGMVKKIEENKDKAAEEIVDILINEGLLLSTNEKRILRSLFDEVQRGLNSYKNAYYRQDLSALIQKGYIKNVDKEYCLTENGLKVTKSYLSNIINENS